MVTKLILKTSSRLLAGILPKPGTGPFGLNFVELIAGFCFVEADFRFPKNDSIELQGFSDTQSWSKSSLPKEILIPIDNSLHDSPPLVANLEFSTMR